MQKAVSCTISVITFPAINVKTMAEADTLKAYNGIYLEIIMRHRDYIEEKEGLYVADLPKLVTPSDDAVILAAMGIKNSFPIYSYDDNFPDAASLAYKYVTQTISSISLPIQFWLKPAQTIRHYAGDIFDKAVLLCSILVALGCVPSRVVVSVRDTERRFVVYSEFKGRLICMDLENGINEYENMDSMLKGMGVETDGDATAYEFNDRMYRDIA